MLFASSQNAGLVSVMILLISIWPFQMSLIDKIILEELQKIRPIRNSMIELVIFLYNTCILYKQMWVFIHIMVYFNLNHFLNPVFID